MPYAALFRYGTSPVVSGGWSPRFNLSVRDRQARYEIALPGFEKSQIEVRCESGVLSVASTADLPYPDYLVVGAPVKPFSMQWRVPDRAVVREATFSNGLLAILMELEPSQPITIL